MQALSEGNELMDRGMNGSGYLQFVRYAMVACWQASMRDELERYAQALEEYTRAEPLPRSDFFIAWTRALAAVGRGERSDSITLDITKLIAHAGDFGYQAPVPALENALAQL